MNNDDFFKDNNTILNLFCSLLELIGLIIVFGFIFKFFGLILVIITYFESYFLNLLI